MGAALHRTLAEVAGGDDGEWHSFHRRFALARLPGPDLTGSSPVFPATLTSMAAGKIGVGVAAGVSSADSRAGHRQLFRRVGTANAFGNADNSQEQPSHIYTSFG
jgi:hypothetical protein